MEICSSNWLPMKDRLDVALDFILRLTAERQVHVHMGIEIRRNRLDPKRGSGKLVPIETLDVEIGIAADDQVGIDDAAKADADIATGSIRSNRIVIFQPQIEEDDRISRLRKRNKAFESSKGALLVAADNRADLWLPESGSCPCTAPEPTSAAMAEGQRSSRDVATDRFRGGATDASHPMQLLSTESGELISPNSCYSASVQGAPKHYAKHVL